MAKARITLGHNGPVKFDGNGYTIERGQSIICVKPADIMYFQAQGGFEIVMLEGDTPKPAEPEPSEESEESEATGEVTEADLNKMTKKALVEYASVEGLEVELNETMSKADMIKAILAAVSPASEE